MPVTALDAGHLSGEVGLRPGHAGERLGRGPHDPGLPVGRLVLADADGPVGELFGDVAEHVRPGRRTRALRLVAVRIPGVPPIHVEEALWTAREALGG